MDTLLEVEDLSVSLSTRSGTLRAVRGIDFSVAAGETLCLVGDRVAASPSRRLRS